MPSYATGMVTEILEERPGLQRVRVDLGASEPERAYVLTQLTGEVRTGEMVVVNTTAVELGLGTGGWHVVHWNLNRTEWHEPGPGHIMKLRYTSLQVDAGSTAEHTPALADVVSAEGLSVVGASLHSQVPAIALGARSARPAIKIAYVMTDGASLPIALSDLVFALRALGILDTTITCGHAFGGDHEAVGLHDALAIAKHVVAADLAIVAMGPGVVGTNTALGSTALELGAILDTATGLGVRPIATLRASLADGRDRHRGISHHTIRTLTLATRSPVRVALPAVGGVAERTLRADLERSGIPRRHEVTPVAVPDVVAEFERLGLAVTSMGRPASDDPILFQCGAAAGVLATRLP